MIHPAATAATPGPFGPSALAADLRALGLRDGDVVMAHVSVRSLGWVIGGGVGLLRAVREVLGPRGGLLVPTFTTYLCDPSRWAGRPVPQAWWDAVRAEQPAFDPHLHASQPGLGRFPEIVRSHPDAVRTGHPLFSLAGLGDGATALLDPSPDDWTLGTTGPLQRLVETGGKVLTIGPPWWSKCTLFHLAEHRADYRGRLMYTAAARVRVDGAERWRDTRQLVFHDGDFPALGEACAAAVTARGTVGAGPAALVRADAVVRTATRWLTDHRDLTGAHLPEPFRDAVPAPSGRL